MTPEQMWESERGWEGHELSQFRRCAAWPLHQKIAWLEEAQLLAQQLLHNRQQVAPLPLDDARRELLGKSDAAPGS